MQIALELRASFEVRTRTGSSFAPRFCAPTGVSGKWSIRSLIPDLSPIQFLGGQKLDFESHSLLDAEHEYVTSFRVSM